VANNLEVLFLETELTATARAVLAQTSAGVVVIPLGQEKIVAVGTKVAILKALAE